MAEEVTISITEFQHLQETINQLKQDAYDWGEREKKYKQRLEAAQSKAKAAAASAGTSSGGSGSWFGGNAGGNKQEVQELKKQLANMKRLLAQTKEEHFVQSQALRENMKNLCSENESMSKELEETNAKLLAAVSFSANAPVADDQLLRSPSSDLVSFEDQTRVLLDQHAAEKKELEGRVEELEAQAATGGPSQDETIVALQNQVAQLQSELSQAREEQSTCAVQGPADESSESERERKRNAREESIKERADTITRQEQQMEQSLGDIQKQSEALAHREAELQAQERSLISRDEALKAKETALDEKEKELSAKSRESTVAKEETSDSEEKQQSSAVSEELETMRQAMQHTQERLVILTEEKNNITLQLADMVAKYDALQAELESAQAAANSSLQEEYEALQAEFTTLKDEKEKDSTRMSKALEEAEQEVARAQAGEANAKEELLLTQQDREIIISKMAEKDLNIDELRDELKTANALAGAAKKAGEEQAELERAKGQQLLAKKVQDMTEEAEMLKKKVRILQEQLTEEEQEHKRQLQELNSTSERASDFEELVSLKSKEIRDLRSQLADTQAMMEAAQDVAAEARERADKLQEQFTEREQSIINVTEKYRRVESELNAMSIRKEEVVSRNQAVIDEIKASHLAEKQELQSQLQEALHRLEQTSIDLEALRKQHARLTKSHEHCGSRIDSLEKETTQQAEELEQLKSSNQTFTVEAASLKEQLSTAQSTVEELEREKLDAEMQHQVENKKNQRLVKDLQARLAQRSASAPVEAPAADPVPRRREASLTSMPTPPASANRRSLDGTAQAIPRRAASPAPAAVSTDVEALGLKVGELQKRTFDQQEHIRKLKEKIGALNQQLKKKNIVIQQHLAKMPVSGRATPAMDSHKLQRAGREGGFMSRLFGGPGVEPEAPDVTAKISQVLEDTILRNVQLQQDMDTMGHEIERLYNENKALKGSAVASP